MLLTTALLYWSGTGDVLPVTAKTIHSRGTNSISKKTQNKRKPSVIIRILIVWRKPWHFLFLLACFLLSQSQDNRDKAHRCCSSEASVRSQRSRLGLSIIPQSSLSLGLCKCLSLVTQQHLHTRVKHVSEQVQWCALVQIQVRGPDTFQPFSRE